MRRWIAAVPLVVLAVLAVMFGVYSLGRDTQIEPNALIGKPLPDREMTTLDGLPTTLRAEIKGPTLINVFGSWCATCIVESPELMDLKAKGVRIVGLAWRDEPRNTRAFLARWGDPFAVVVMDPASHAVVDLGVPKAPETFLVASDGTILHKHPGQVTKAVAADLYRRVQAAR